MCAVDSDASLMLQNCNAQLLLCLAEANQAAPGTDLLLLCVPWTKEAGEWQANNTGDTSCVRLSVTEVELNYKNATCPQEDPRSAEYEVCI